MWKSFSRFHVFGIGQHSRGFTIRFEVKTWSKVFELIISHGSRTTLSSDSILRVNLIGDYVGYNDVLSFENFFLVVPRQHEVYVEGHYVKFKPYKRFEEFSTHTKLWKNRVKKIHLKESYEEVDKAVEALSLAVTEDFLPIISRIKATTTPFGGVRGEITYAREHKSVWFKVKRFAPSGWANTPGEEQIKQLKPSIDSKGRKVGEEWFTTVKVENALTRYHEAGANAKTMVLELLRGLSKELQDKINVLIFASMLLVIAKALFAHVSEGKRRRWEKGEIDGMKITGLSPYWFDAAKGSVVVNTIEMKSIFLLTGPNGGGKSSLLRSICVAALFGICGFMVPT
ncbi:unnamed protein product [Lactuca virosa]|uniref:Generative cell specific-1/HAP2 domain-containing protein n=1 Tax=Lactuca virosa TaxID=75947 RepID=A0AAU9M294_9ASTR|nr:unnamed protein product [Lactuca virosa]